MKVLIPPKEVIRRNHLPQTPTNITHPTPFGFMPKLPGEDDKVDWVRTTIEVKAYLKRFVGYVKVLLEPQPVDPNERAAHAESMGQAFNTVYSLLVEMCGPNETAMRQVFDHALVDPDQYPSTLWGMLEVRFTQARLLKLQGFLNEIGHFKLLPNEENNIFIDRFKNWLVRSDQLILNKCQQRLV